MRKLLSILLLVIFVVQSTSQLWVLAVFYVQRDFIAATKCINRFKSQSSCKGNCVLKKQIEENEDRQKQQFPDLKQKEILLYCSAIPVFFNAITLAEETNRSYTSLSVPFLPAGYVHGIFKPPAQA